MLIYDPIPHNFIIPSSTIDLSFVSKTLNIQSYNNFNNIFSFKNILLNSEHLINHYESFGTYYDVGVNGISKDVGVGSKRKTFFDILTASQITTYLNSNKSFTENCGLLYCTSDTLTDWYDSKEDQYCLYKFHSVSPVLRYMRYEDNGEHYPHYDSSYLFKLSPNYRTLQSLVLYLTDCNSGSIDFINDTLNMALPVQLRIYSDWTRQAFDTEKEISILPSKGSMVIFPHRICHGVSKNNFENRIIIRMDLVYEKVSNH